MTENEIDIAQLEREGDIAADYLEALLDIADLDGDLNLGVRGNRAVVTITGGGHDLHRLGSTEVAQALQNLVRLAVQHQTGQFSRLLLDIAGSTEARQAQLRQEADHAIAQIAAGKADVVLPAMSSYDRKIVHDYVAERGYVSQSHGEGKDRRLVITAE